MILDALKYLVALGASTSKAEYVLLPDDKVGLIINGVLTEYDADARSAKAVVGSLESLIDWCAARTGLPVEIYVKPSAVFVEVLPYSTAGLRQCSLALERSQAWMFLQQWIAQPLSQKLLVRGLRGPLSGCFDESYLATFRSLDFARRNDGSRTVEHAKESLGRFIEAQAQSRAGEIPQMMAFDVPVFALTLVDNIQRLRFAIEVDAEAEKICMAPIGDCVDEAIRNARESIVSLLKERIRDAEVYLGE